MSDLIERLREPVTLSGMRSSVSVYQSVIVDRAKAADALEARDKTIAELCEAMKTLRSQYLLFVNPDTDQIAAAVCKLTKDALSQPTNLTGNEE